MTHCSSSRLIELQLNQANQIVDYQLSLLDCGKNIGNQSQFVYLFKQQNISLIINMPETEFSKQLDGIAYDGLIFQQHLQAIKMLLAAWLGENDKCDIEKIVCENENIFLSGIIKV